MLSSLQEIPNRMHGTLQAHFAYFRPGHIFLYAALKRTSLQLSKYNMLQVSKTKRYDGKIQARAEKLRTKHSTQMNRKAIRLLEV